MNAITAEELERALTNYLCTHSNEEIQEDLDRITSKYTSEELEKREKDWTDIFGPQPEFDPKDLLIECDLCHDGFGVRDLYVDPNGMYVYCKKCR